MINFDEVSILKCKLIINIFYFILFTISLNITLIIIRLY